MAFQGDSIFWVEVEKVVPNPYQPRREFDEGKLKELADSVRMYGILQPLTVTRKEIQNEDGSFRSEYELIAGERRMRAAKLAGLTLVPVIIRDNEDTEQEKLELAIIENLQREDLNAVDRALAFQQLADAFKLTHDEVAKKVGRSRMYVSNTIRLLALPEYMLQSLKIGDLSEGHARTLLMLKDRPEEQDVVYREILMKKLSVREVERIVRKIATDKVRKKKWKGTDPHLIVIEKEFTDALGTRVQIAKTDYGGKVTIDYFSEEDLQKLLSIMKRREEQKTEGGEDGESTTVVQSMAAMMAATPLVEDTVEKETVDEIKVETIPTQNEEQAIVEQSKEEVHDRIDNQGSEPDFGSESVLHASESIPEPTESAEVVNSPADDFLQAMTEASEETDDFEQSIIDAANRAGAESGRPNTPEEKVEHSASLREEVDKQMNQLTEHEANYTPAVESQPVMPEKKDDEDSDLYSIRSFSL